MEGSLGVTVLGLVTGEVPDDQGLVSGGREEHVGAIRLLVQASSYISSISGSTYFSMEVAKLVTQPFYTQSVRLSVEENFHYCRCSGGKRIGDE